MTRSAARPPLVDRLLVVGWAGVAVSVAFLASVVSGALAGAAVPVLVGTSVTRSGMDVAAVACVGLTVLGLLLPRARDLPGSALRPLADVRTAADRALVACAGAWLALVVVGIGFRAATSYGRSLGQLSAGEVGRWVGQLAAGRGMVLTAGCVAVVLGCAVARLRDRAFVQVRVPLVAAVIGAITPAVTGHAGAAPDHQLAVMTIGVHVGAAALWAGGLGGVLVLVARHRELVGAVLPRFSRLAGVCIAAVAVSGVLTAAVRLGSWQALGTTGYGWLVLAKTGCLLLIGGLGGLTRRRLAAGRVPVLRWTGLEVALMAVALGLAAALTQTP
jgi:copper resistance protein D